MESINKLQSAQRNGRENVLRENVLESLENETVYTDLGGRVIDAGLWTGTRMGTNVMFQHPEGFTVNVPVSEIKEIPGL